MRRGAATQSTLICGLEPKKKMARRGATEGPPPGTTEGPPRGGRFATSSNDQLLRQALQTDLRTNFSGDIETPSR